MKCLFAFVIFHLWETVTAQILNEIDSTGHRIRFSSINEQTVAQCLQPILTYAASIQDKTNGDHFSLQSDDIFKRLCVLYSDFRKCTNSINCHSISMEAVEASYGFMCGPGYKLFEEHAACFAEIENQDQYVVCKNSANESMDDALKVKKEDSELYIQKLCSIMDNYLRCCRPFVYEKCGPEAWRLVSQITINSLHVTMPTCDINRALL